jgi:hypothetical protein
MEDDNIFRSEAQETLQDIGPEAVGDGGDGTPADAGGADIIGADGGSDQSFTLKHLDEIRTVGRGEVITLAQKGLDYDRIRGKYDEAAAALSKRDGLTIQAAAPEQAAAAKRQTEIREFLAEYGTDIDPKAIPQEVWQSVAGGKTLLAAYQAWELHRLRLESRAAQKNTENMTRSAGSRFSLGNMKPSDAITDDWYGN